MHISLDQALGRQPRLNRVGQSILNIGGDASAAYSLRSLTGDEPKAVRIRRDGDNEERDFTTAEIVNEAAAWTNGLQETTLPADLPSTSSSITGFTVSGTDSQFNSTFTLLESQLNGKNQYVHSSESTRKIRYRSDGKWELDQDGDQYQVSVDVGRDYPWDVVDWVQGPEGSGGDPVFSSFVGGNPDNSAAAAYSLRKVKSDYTGHAVRIRREFDDIEVNVSFDTNNEVSINSPISDVVEEGGEKGDTTATTLGEFLTLNNINKLDLQPATSGLDGNISNETTTGFDISVNNEGSNGFKNVLSPSNTTAGTYVATFDVVLNSGSLTGVSFRSSSPEDFTDLVVGSNSITITPNNGSNVYFRTSSGAVANVSITNITFTQTFSGAAVHTWYDQSGNSNNATQNVDEKQPLIAAGGNLLTAGITFDGTNDFLATGQSVITQSSAGSFSYFGVSTIATDEVGYIFGSAGNGATVGSSFYAQDDSKFSLSSGLNLLRDNITRSSGENLLSACYTGGRANFRVNSGGTSVTSGTYSFNANANFTIGNRESGSSAATFLAGSIKEIIAYDSDQTNNRFKIESNINNHYTIYTAAQNGFVHTWYDQSGNGFNAVADADVNEPKIVNSGSLLTDGLKFSLGNNLKLSGTGLDIFKNTQYAQVFYAIKINDTSTSTTGFFEARNNSSQARFLLRNSNANAGRISLGGRRLDSDSFSSFQSNSGHSNEKIVLTGFINYSDADAFIFKNGTQIGSDTSFLTAGATSDTRSTIISIGRAGASATAEFDAEELIIFNTDQTANRTAIETNIANKYGITLS